MPRPKEFDCGNILAYGSPQQWIRELGSRLLKVHVKDFAASKPASKKYGSELGAAHKKGVSATETLSHYRRVALILQSISACASPLTGGGRRCREIAAEIIHLLFRGLRAG